MSKVPSKKGIERRKKPRGAKSAQPKVKEYICRSCSKHLGKNARALFVEEEIGRVFCSEECITHYFVPDVERLEREYTDLLTHEDLTGEEREKLAHLRWLTLQEPDEVWRQKTPTGDFRYTLISEFQPTQTPIWYICICLFLRGEPSFLYLAFPTKNTEMVDSYRRGEKIQWIKTQNSSENVNVPKELHDEPKAVDGLADAWTEDETRRAQFLKDRRKDDIPVEEFSLYQGCFDETLENPDEVWTQHKDEKEPIKTYHFIRYYPEDKPGMWFLIIAKETEDEEEIEILEAFPTRDSSLVEYFRRGHQEIGVQESQSTSRLVH